MIETFAALLFAHVLADFVLQTRWSVDNKRRPGPLLLHGAVVLLTAQLALGRADAWELGALAAAHLAIDIVKTFFLPRGITAFLADQAAHLATLFVVAAFAPELWAGGYWNDAPWLLPPMVCAAGLIVTTRAGGFAVGLLMQPWSEVEMPRGLAHGGRLIGLLERGIIFLLVMVGQPVGIGFLIAAKSVLRFDTTSTDQRAGEYVIVGTLASFGWAIATSYATLWLVQALPPLGFLPPKT